MSRIKLSRDLMFVSKEGTRVGVVFLAHSGLYSIEGILNAGYESLSTVEPMYDRFTETVIDRGIRVDELGAKYVDWEIVPLSEEAKEIRLSRYKGEMIELLIANSESQLAYGFISKALGASYSYPLSEHLQSRISLALHLEQPLYIHCATLIGETTIDTVRHTPTQLLTLASDLLSHYTLLDDVALLCSNVRSAISVAAVRDLTATII